MLILLLKIGKFVLFLISYGGLAWVVNATEKIRRRKQLSGVSVWIIRLNALLSILFFFLFIYLLSGFLSIPLILLFLFASVFGEIVSQILWSVLGYGMTAVEWRARALWAGAEVAIQQRTLMLFSFLLTTLAFILYPIISGFFYFTLPADRLPVRIFQVTLATLVLSGYSLILSILTPVLTSENVDEKTRTRFLVTQLSALISNGCTSRSY